MYQVTEIRKTVHLTEYKAELEAVIAQLNSERDGLTGPAKGKVTRERNRLQAEKTEIADTLKHLPPMPVNPGERRAEILEALFSVKAAAAESHKERVEELAADTLRFFEWSSHVHDLVMSAAKVKLADQVIGILSAEGAKHPADVTLIARIEYLREWYGKERERLLPQHSDRQSEVISKAARAEAQDSLLRWDVGWALRRAEHEARDGHFLTFAMLKAWDIADEADGLGMMDADTAAELVMLETEAEHVKWANDMQRQIMARQAAI